MRHIIIGVVAAGLACAPPPAPAIPPPADRADVCAPGAPQVAGVLSILYGDPPAGPPTRRYLLAADDGRNLELDVDDHLVHEAGGPVVLQGRRVRLGLETPAAAGGLSRVCSIQPLQDTP
jgi:hypothetical protein